MLRIMLIEIVRQPCSDQYSVKGEIPYKFQVKFPQAFVKDFHSKILNCKGLYQDIFIQHW